MSKEKSTLTKRSPKDFSLHLPDQVLSDKDLEARFKNLKQLLAKAHKSSAKNA